MPQAPTSKLLRHVRQQLAAHDNHTSSDQELLRRFVAGREEAAFAALVQRYGPLVLGVCRRVLGHEQDAEDAFQATFLVLARRASSLRKPDGLASWLYGVAHRVAELQARRQFTSCVGCRSLESPTIWIDVQARDS